VPLAEPLPTERTTALHDEGSGVDVRSHAGWLVAVPRRFRSLKSCRHDDVFMEAIADWLGWGFQRAQLPAANLAEHGVIETDADLGLLPTVVEGDA
jgi:hypothetical protein